LNFVGNGHGKENRFSSIISVFVLQIFLGLKKGSIKNSSSTLSVFGALNHGFNLDVTTKGLGDALHEPGSLELVLGFRSIEDSEGSLSELVAHVLPVLGLIVSDGNLDIFEDVFAVDLDVLHSFDYERSWVQEDSGHLLQLFEVILGVCAILGSD
jgi:hypothetical protein